MPILAFLLALAAIIIVVIVIATTWRTFRQPPWMAIAALCYLLAWVWVYVHPDTNPFLIK